jgi:hypothetical protein
LHFCDISRLIPNIKDFILINYKVQGYILHVSSPQSLGDLFTDIPAPTSSTTHVSSLHPTRRPRQVCIVLLYRPSSMSPHLAHVVLDPGSAPRRIWGSAIWWASLRRGSAAITVASVCGETMATLPLSCVQPVGSGFEEAHDASAASRSVFLAVSGGAINEVRRCCHQLAWLLPTMDGGVAT